MTSLADVSCKAVTVETEGKDNYFMDYFKSSLQSGVVWHPQPVKGTAQQDLAKLDPGSQNRILSTVDEQTVYLLQLPSVPAKNL